MSQDEPSILLEENSPNGFLSAVVEAQRGVVYLYLSGPKETFGMRGVWVRNLAPGPATIDTDAMKEGYPPLLPASACAHPQGAKPLDGERLRLTWMEEGDGVALFEGDELLAVIPAWAGVGDFRGYARDCTQQTPLCWPLKEAEALPRRIADAAAFFKSWEKGHWADLQPKFLDPYTAALGKEAKYWAADEGKWPPKGIVRYDDEAIVFLTLGMSIQPQPHVEMSVADAAPHRRVELGLAFKRLAVDEAALERAVHYISAQTNLPWYGFTWLGNGHTIECDPSPAGAEFKHMLLLKDPPGAPDIAMPTYRGDPINLLWMVPITAAERELTEKQGGELLRRLREAKVTYAHHQRASVA